MTKSDEATRPNRNPLPRGGAGLAAVGSRRARHKYDYNKLAQKCLTVLTLSINVEPMARKDHISTAEVAKLLGVSRQTLYNWMHAGRIPEPPRNPLTNHMRWQPVDVQRIQKLVRESEAE
jgi:predicted DNA-binding transcriptional regulator AlpA